MAFSIDKGKIIPERLWAWDIKEEDFQLEFTRRYPMSDVVPTRSKYLLYKVAEHRSIDSFNEEQILVEHFEKKDPTPENWDCKGCGREFAKNHIGRKNHVKKCKGLMNERT